MTPFALRGNVIWAPGPGELSLLPRGYVVCGEAGDCAGAFPALPDRYAGLPVRDLGEALVLPGYADLHTHAAQYGNLGLGMDLTLIEWLDTLTYPEEARFAREEHARAVYGRFVDELRAGLTTRACVFATAHTEGTLVLMDLLEASGLRVMAGRVNMDRNAPDTLREPDASAALSETEGWLEKTGRYERTAPILTPRFVPSCTPALLRGLGALAGERGLPVQSHLDETPEEVAWVQKLHPESESYAAVYDAAGLLGPRTVLAHCIYMTDEETALLKERGVFIAHCPASNMNVRSGIAPVRRLLDQGMNIGLGTDISGGHSPDMAQAVRDALSVSRLLWRMDPGAPAHLTAAEAFWLATAGGGAFFGRVGKFEPGYAFDAVAADDGPAGEDLARRLERFIYRGSSHQVIAKYVAGRRLF